MTNFADYYLERLGLDTFENEDGFIVYHVEREELFIKEYYVRPESRNVNTHAFFDDKMVEIANQNKCKYLSCGVSIKALTADHALQFIMRRGFKLNSANNDYIILTRELEHG
jgi:hypothetical protein